MMTIGCNIARVVSIIFIDGDHVTQNNGDSRRCSSLQRYSTSTMLNLIPDDSLNSLKGRYQYALLKNHFTSATSIAQPLIGAWHSCNPSSWKKSPGQFYGKVLNRWHSR